MNLTWWHKILFKTFPMIAVRLFSKEIGLRSSPYEAMHDSLLRVKRIDFFPSSSGHRGLIMVLDQTTALFFYQEDDYFKYDGFEIGEYQVGEVSVFDDVRQPDKGLYDC